MNHLKRRVILSSLSAIACISAGCGSSSEDSASPSTLPFEEPITTVVEAPSTSVAPETTAAAAPAIDAAMFESMLETENGRALLVSSIASEVGLELEAAECLLDGIPVDMLVEAAGSFMGGASEAGLFPAEQMAELGPLLESCSIDPQTLTP